MQYTVSLKLNHVFQRLYRRGARSAAPTLALYSRPNGRDHNRLGLTTGAKLGHAVVRNKLRRRLRAIYRIHEAELKSGYDIVIVISRATQGVKVMTVAEGVKVIGLAVADPDEEEPSDEGESAEQNEAE